MDGTMEPRMRRGYTQVVPTDLQTSTQSHTTGCTVGSLHARQICSGSYTGPRFILGQFHPLMKDPKNLPARHSPCPETTSSGSRYRIMSSNLMFEWYNHLYRLISFYEGWMGTVVVKGKNVSARGRTGDLSRKLYVRRKS